MVEIYINGCKIFETYSTFRAIRFIKNYKDNKKGRLKFYCDDTEQNNFIEKYINE